MLMPYIEDYINDNNVEYSLYNYRADIKVNDAPIEIQEVLNLLREKVNFGYSSNLCQENPFTQAYCFVNGPQSIKIEELTKDDANALLNALQYIKAPLTKAKIYDILGILTNQKIYKKSSADNYRQFILQNVCVCEHNNLLSISLQRSLFLYHELHDVNEKSFTQEIFTTIQYRDKNQEFMLKYYTVTALYKMNATVPLNNVIPDIERLVEVYDKTNAQRLIKLLSILINCYKSIHNDEKLYSAVDKYISFCEQACADFSPHGYKYIDTAVDLLIKDKKLKHKYEDKINELAFKRDAEHKKFYNGMNFIELPIDDNIKGELKIAHNTYEERIKSLQSGLQQFISLLNNFKPITQNELENNLKQQNHSILNCLNEIVFDDNGTIAFESVTATEDEKRQMQIAQCLQFDLNVKYCIFLQSFIFNLNVDNELKQIIYEIVDSNLIVPSERKAVVSAIILDGFNKNIRKAVYDLISQFEYGIKKYLQSKNIYPIIYQGSTHKNIDLNHMLRSSQKQNRFRSTLEEVFGIDLLLELEYLLCNRYLGNLRNNNYHEGYGDLNEYTIYEASAFYFLVEAYCLACD